MPTIKTQFYNNIKETFASTPDSAVTDSRKPLIA